MRLVSPQDDLGAARLRPDPLQVIEAELLGHEHIADRLRCLVHAEGDARHDHRRGREGADALVHRLLRGTESARPHLRDRQEDPRPVHLAEVEIDAVFDGNWLRLAARGLPEDLQDGQALDRCDGDDQDIGVWVRHGV
jgi:hypothetical protein